MGSKSARDFYISFYVKSKDFKFNRIARDRNHGFNEHCATLLMPEVRGPQLESDREAPNSEYREKEDGRGTVERTARGSRRGAI